jgi:HEAT repeat protein
LTAWMTAAVLFGLLSGSGSAANPTEEWEAVTTLVDRIKAEAAVTPRTEQAQKLAGLVRSKTGKVAPKRVIRALAGLMEDRDDSVRYWAAMALGYMGPQATDAIPALEKALKEIERHPADKTSESAIRLALRRINPPAK